MTAYERAQQATAAQDFTAAYRWRILDYIEQAIRCSRYDPQDRMARFYEELAARTALLAARYSLRVWHSEDISPFKVYVLPDGTRVACDRSATKSRQETTFQMKDRRVVIATEPSCYTVPCTACAAAEAVATVSVHYRDADQARDGDIEDLCADCLEMSRDDGDTVHILRDHQGPQPSAPSADTKGQN